MLCCRRLSTHSNKLQAANLRSGPQSSDKFDFKTGINSFKHFFSFFIFVKINYLI